MLRRYIETPSRVLIARGWSSRTDGFVNLIRRALTSRVYPRFSLTTMTDYGTNIDMTFTITKRMNRRLQAQKPCVNANRIHIHLPGD